MSTSVQRSFAAGELTPALYARTDLAKYAIALRTCRNFVVMRQGGANYRPGLGFCEEVKNSAMAVRLIKFVFNKNDALVMEFGNTYIRFTQDGAPVLDGSTPVEVVTPYVTADLPLLNYVQSGDVVTLTHAKYPPAELRRTSNTSWAYVVTDFSPSIVAPTGISVVGTVDVNAHTYQYAVTAIDDVTGEESFADVQASFHAWSDPSAAEPHTVTWDVVAGASTYNVYLAMDKGALGFLGTATSANLTFINTGLVTLDPTSAPPEPFTDFEGAGNYPAVCSYYQQRAVFAATTNHPSRVWASRSGNYHNFTKSTPIQDDSAIVFTMVSDEVDEIKHMLTVGKLVIGTEGAEWLIDGDPNGTLTPSSVNDRIGSYNGSDSLRPIKCDNSILYVQAQGNMVLALKANVLYGYYTFQNEDLTLTSSHLFKRGFTIVDWDYQKTPNNTVWAVRSDGVLLGFTYLPDQQFAAWHRHDTDGFVENVCIIPEGFEDSVYVVVRRTIQGVTRRYIERLQPLEIIDQVADPRFVDSGLEYDGRDAGAEASTTMTLSGGTTWAYDELLTLNASAAYFTAGMVNDVIVLHGADGTVIRFTIQAQSSSTIVTGHTDKTVPASMQTVPITLWDHAVPTVAGLEHLEGEAISVYADGFVVASPNNDEYDVITVSGGLAVLDKAYTHIWAGLPYIGDLETLDIDTPQGQTLKDTKINISRIGLYVEDSRGTFVGVELATGDDALEGLDEIKFRDDDDDMNEAPPSLTKYMFADVSGSWNKTGRGVVRQVDPLPLNVLAIMPQGLIPDGR
jgi:hypothetical protein